MRLLKVGMRIWIMLTTIASFLVGWAMLAHAPKPVQPITPPKLAPLEPLHFNEDDDGFGNGPTIIARSPSFFPTFRTGGS